MTLIVGVTGGIGSGKSTAARLFQQRGADLVDTDAIAHDLTLPGQSALEQIADALGTRFLTADGSLDRTKLRDHVFANPAARKTLEAILHPMIAREVQDRLHKSTAPYVLLLVPLLVETGGYRDLVQRVLVVDCDEKLQIRRAMQRSGLTESEVRAVMQAQAKRGERLAAADDLIRNDGSLEELERQVDALDARYRTMVDAG
jgi:dephospho-CoA kinase